MLLKRIYEEADLERYRQEKDAATQEAKEKLKDIDLSPDLLETFVRQMVDQKNIQPPKLDYISLANTGTTPEQNFSTTLVTEGLQSGLMEINDDELVFHVFPEDLIYTIKRTPGRYCLHCGEKLENDATGELARLHIAMKHAGVPSPIQSVPAGYEAINHFECVLDTNQHEKYRVKNPARAPYFPTKEKV